MVSRMDNQDNRVQTTLTNSLALIAFEEFSLHTGHNTTYT